MKKISLILLFFAFNSIFCQIIDETVQCQPEVLASMKNKTAGIYYDKEYVKTVKQNVPFSLYFAIKIPKTVGEARKMEGLSKLEFFIANNIDILYVNLVNIDNMPPGTKIKFNLRDFLPGEVFCAKVEGKIPVKGYWNPKLNIFATVKYFSMELSKRVEWNGLNVGTY